MGDGEGLVASQWGLLGGSLGGDAVVGQPGAKRGWGEGRAGLPATSRV